MTNVAPGCDVVEWDLTVLRELIDAAVEEVVGKLECRPPITVHGRKCRQRRDIGFFATDMRIPGYRYSNQLMRSQPAGKHMTELIATVNELFGATTNAVLVNRYPGAGKLWGDGTVATGDSCIGAHQDDETGLMRCRCVGGECKGKGCPAHVGVIAISVGGVRPFRVRQPKQPYVDIPTKPHHALQMRGTLFQKKCTHEIPPRKKVTDTRISLTFRCHAVPAK